MGMQVKGILIQVLKKESGVSKGGKEWTKQDFVIETNEQFPKKVCFTLFGDKVSLIEGVSEGSEVEVYFNVESRDFNGKWFHNINAWKVDAEKVATNTTGGGKAYETGLTKPSAEIPTQQDIPDEPEGDDLPF